MRYVSTFSGIEAASVAWDCLGWDPMAFCEIDQFPSAVLAERYPGVPNLGDMTKVDWRNFAKRNGKPDLLVGGSPCQSFSIAGTRTGLDGASGLMWEYVRAVRELRPRWILWENVPGALSSTHGEDLRCLLEALDGIGYGLAWRVLDAQFFGVAQRRRRVFLVGHLGERPPVEVLFEPDGLRWDTPQSREKRKELAKAAGRGARCAGLGAGAGSVASAPAVHSMHQNQVGDIAVSEESCGTLTSGSSVSRQQLVVSGQCVAIQGSMIGRADENGPQGSGIETDGACYTLNCTDRHAVMVSDRDTAYALKLRHTGSENKGGGQGPLVQEDVSATLATNQDQTIFQPSAIPINEMIATRGGKLGRGTGFGVGEDGDPANTITANHPHAVAVTQYGEEVGGTLTARFDSSPCGDRGQNIVCLGDDNAKASCDEEMAGSLKCGGSAPIAASSAMVVRRLTPTECERLQGFPDGWTLIPYKGKPAEECPDGPRYKAIGNSMAVPVMRWIGERIDMFERGEIG